MYNVLFQSSKTQCHQKLWTSWSIFLKWTFFTTFIFVTSFHNFQCLRCFEISFLLRKWFSFSPRFFKIISIFKLLNLKKHDFCIFAPPMGLYYKTLRIYYYGRISISWCVEISNILLEVFIKNGLAYLNTALISNLESFKV